MMRAVLIGGKTQGFFALLVLWAALLCRGAQAQAQAPTPEMDVEVLAKRAQALIEQGFEAYAIATMDDMLTASRAANGERSLAHGQNALRAGRMAFDAGAQLWARDALNEAWKSLPLPQVESELGVRILVARGRVESALGQSAAARSSFDTARKLAARLPGEHGAVFALVELDEVRQALEREDAAALKGADRLVAEVINKLKAEPSLAVEHARALALAAEILVRRGELALAIRTLREARSKLLPLGLGKGRLYLDWTHGVARIAQLSGRGPAALTLYRQAATGRQRLLEAVSRHASQADLRDYDQSFRSDLDGLVSLDLNPVGLAVGSAEQEQLRRAAANLVLRRKGWIVEAQVQQLAYARALGTKQASEVADLLMRAQGRFANLIVRGPLFNKPWDSVVLRRLSEGKRAAERLLGRLALSERPPAFLPDESLPDKVQAGLPDGAAHIEFVVYRPIDTDRAGHEDLLDEPHYAAYLFRKGQLPLAIPLGPARRIDEAIAEYRKQLSTPTSSPDAAARSLDALVMEPVRERLGDERSLFVAPDGQLSLIPFAALEDESGAHLIHRYSIKYLSSGRELAERRKPLAPSSSSQMVVVANPSFSLGETGGAEKGGEPKALMAGIAFPPLPGTAQEGQRLSQQHSGSVLITGPEASEARIKALRSPRILHIATHGFFLSGEQAVQNGTRGLKRVAAEASEQRSIVAGPAHNEPLLRSGLAFANANGTRSEAEERGRDIAAQGSDDGVLTALEASTLDLSGTELVVLSACETGLGEVRNGDGVYGLRRALAIAGARSQVMSLWKVSDAATRDLMSAYYQGLEREEGRAESLRRAQLAISKSEAWAHPYYWASFIPSGEDRSLGGREPTLVDPAAVDPWRRGKDGDGHSRALGAATPGQVKPVQKGCACKVGESAIDQRGELLLLLFGLLAAGRIRKVSQ